MKKLSIRPRYYDKNQNVKAGGGQTIFLLFASRNASSAKSFVGTSFADGMILDKRIKIFWRGTGGVMSSAIFATGKNKCQEIEIRISKIHNFLFISFVNLKRLKIVLLYT